MNATTTLLLASQRLPAAWPAARIPPQVEALPLVPLHWEAQGDGRFRFSQPLPEAVLPRISELLPCFSCAAVRGFQFTLEYQLPGEAAVRQVRLEPIGDFPAAPALPADPAIEAAIDLFVNRCPPQIATLQLEVVARNLDDLRAAPGLLSLSLRQPGPFPAPAPAAAGTMVDMKVPARSQMQLDPALARHVCSPTCLSMLLEFYGRPNDVYEVIARVRHAPTGLSGVWPANVQAAAGYGLLGYLLHFPCWEAARWLLDRGVPIIASVRYEPGELHAAAVPRTAGHLILLRGYRGAAVRVNDPAAATDAQVVREYDLQEWAAIWLGRTAVGYVLFPVEEE